MLKNVEVADYRDPDIKYALPYKEKRDCYEQIEEYVSSEYAAKICAIYGLRRTGKTTLMQQCIENMSKEDRERTLFLTCKKGSEIYQISDFIQKKLNEDYKFFFIDEITFAEDFQAVGEVFANYHVSLRGARIVVTGTDSLGLSLPSHDLQYDRTLFVHTTYISFSEYSRLTSCKDVDEYIRLGGVLVPSVFSDYYTTHDYIETSIANNLINSLENSEGIRRYPAVISEFYEKNELKNVIERIINTYSQDITLKAIRKEFKSAPISASIRNIVSNRENPEDLKQYINFKQINENIAESLGIIKNDKLTVNVTENHKKEIYDFLQEMDVFVRIPAYKPLEFISHPGMYYANVKYALDELAKKDNWLPNATDEQRKRLTDGAKEFALGILTENCVLADVYELIGCKKNHTPTSYEARNETQWDVSKLNIAIEGRFHEIDMIITDRNKNECFLFEIKHSKENVPEQSVHLENEKLCEYIENNFGEIKGKAVLYNGPTDRQTDVPRISTKHFLNSVYYETKKEKPQILKLLTYGMLSNKELEKKILELSDENSQASLKERTGKIRDIQSVLGRFEDDYDFQALSL